MVYLIQDRILKFQLINESVIPTTTSSCIAHKQKMLFYIFNGYHKWLYKGLHNSLDFVSWPTRPKIFAMCPSVTTFASPWPRERSLCFSHWLVVFYEDCSPWGQTRLSSENISSVGHWRKGIRGKCVGLFPHQFSIFIYVLLSFSC